MGPVAAVPPQIPGLVGWRPLARGGFATVWEARQLSLNRLVAVKVDRRTLDTDAEQRRFLRESGAAGRMSGHPGIVTVHDAGILTDDRPYLVMALCAGGSLTAVGTRASPGPARSEVREVGVRIADALAATHAQGVLHRDVKPANILIDSYGQAGLADFGLAAVPDPGMELSETLEAITPAYAPPEVFHRRTPTETGDVYSLGATLYAMLAGRPPRWPESGTPNIVDMFERLGEPIERIPGVNDDVMDVLLAAMASDPADRPSAAEFRDRLAALPLGPAPDEAEESEPPPALLPRAEPKPERQERRDELEPAAPIPVTADGDEEEKRPRRRTWAVAAALVVIIAVSLAAVLVNQVPRTVGSLPPATTPTTPPAPSSEIAVPASFRDCSDQFGPDTYCTPTPECWGGVVSMADAPYLIERVACNDLHYHQTFAAGKLDFVPLRQSTLVADPQVEKVCRRSILETMLVDEVDRKVNWQVFALPPQVGEANIYRCIFGRGERVAAVKLAPPS